MFAKVIVALCAVGLARAGGLLGGAPLAYNNIAAPAVITKNIAPAVSSISAYSTKQTHPSPIQYAAGHAVAAYGAPNIAAYAAPGVATYAAAPVITKTISPAVSSISAYSTDIAHGSPVAAYAAGPILTKAAYATPAYGAYAGAYAGPAAYAAYAAPASYASYGVGPSVSSVSAYSTKQTHPSPIINYAAAPASYAAYGAPASYAAYGAPAIKTIAPAIAAYSAPLLTKSYATAPISPYALGAPILKSSLAYSGVPALYGGYGSYDGYGGYGSYGGYGGYGSYAGYGGYGANYGWY